MAIKRFTIEIDDSPDTHSATGENLSTKHDEKTYITNQTSSIEPYKDEQIMKTDSISSKKISTGRTLGDIVVEFKDNSRFMTVILVIISFAIFAGKLDSISNFIYPLILSVFLNIIWHLHPLVTRLFSKNLNIY